MGGRPEYCSGVEVVAPNRDEIGVDPVDQATVGGAVMGAADHAVDWCTAGDTATEAINPGGGR